MSTDQAWSDYARAVKKVAEAHAEAQRAQDRLTANRTQAEATALAEVEAAAARGLKLEQRLAALVKRAEDCRQQAGVSTDGPQVDVTLPAVRGTADLEAAAVQVTRQLMGAVERLEATRGAARTDRVRRLRRAVGAALVLSAFVVVWFIERSAVQPLTAAGTALLTVLIMPRWSGSLVVMAAGVAAVVVLVAAGSPWWLGFVIPVTVSGASIVAPNKRN